MFFFGKTRLNKRIARKLEEERMRAFTMKQIISKSTILFETYENKLHFVKIS